MISPPLPGRQSRTPQRCPGYIEVDSNVPTSGAREISSRTKDRRSHSAKRVVWAGGTSAEIIEGVVLPVVRAGTGEVIVCNMIPPVFYVLAEHRSGRPSLPSGWAPGPVAALCRRQSGNKGTCASTTHILLPCRSRQTPWRHTCRGRTRF